MKTSIFVLLFLSAGCSTPRHYKVTVKPRPAVVAPTNLIDRVRYPELVKEYHIGRYVDPNHNLLMHESHTLYRVEAQGSWNLHSPPDCFTLPTGAGILTNAAFAPPAINDAVIAELNHQRAMTRAVTQQAESLSGSLHDFNSALANTRTLADQNKILREQLVGTERRLETLEAEVKKQAHQSSPENETK